MTYRSASAAMALLCPLVASATLFAQQRGDRLFVIEAPHCVGQQMDGTTVTIQRGQLLTLEETAPNFWAIRWQGHYTLVKPQAVLPTREAREYLAELIQRQPTAENYAFKARVEHSLRNLDQAIADANRALELDPKNVMALVFRASAYVLKREFDVAESDLQQALKMAPESYLAHSVRFNLLERTNRKAEALTSVEKAISINPHRALLFANRGAIQLQLDQPYEAVASFQKAIEVEPAANYGYYYLGYHQYRKQEYEKAKLFFETSANLNPDHYWSQYYLAQIAKLERDEQQFVRYLELACDSKDATDSARNHYAWALATAQDPQLRDGARAITIAQKLVEDSPPLEQSSLQLRYLKTLAAAQAELGQFDEALATLAKIDSRRYHDPELHPMYESFEQRQAFQRSDF